MIEGFDFDADFDESMIEDGDYEHYDPYEWDGEFNYPDAEPDFDFEDEDEDWDRFIDLDTYEEEKRQRIAESNEY